MDKLLQAFLKEAKIIFKQEMRWQIRKKLRKGLKKVFPKLK